MENLTRLMINFITKKRIINIAFLDNDFAIAGCQVLGIQIFGLMKLACGNSSMN